MGNLSFSYTVNLPSGPQPGGSCTPVAFPLTSAHHTTPHLTTPHFTSPQLISAHLTSPQHTSPHHTTPHLTTHHNTSLHFTSQHFTTPLFTSRQHISALYADPHSDLYFVVYSSHFYLFTSLLSLFSLLLFSLLFCSL